MVTSRYLTAQKISLLILTEVYCSSVPPSSAAIPVLSFILANSLPIFASSARANYSNNPLPQNVPFSVDSFRNILQSHSSNMPGRTLLDVFLEHMWEMSTFDALHDLFDKLKELTEPPPKLIENEALYQIHLSRTSPLGAFVRRARLEFTRLQFDDSVALWQAFIKYRAPTAQWTKRLASIASSGVDIVIAEMGLGSSNDIYDIVYGSIKGDPDQRVASLDDLDRVLEFQLDRLQRFGDRIPDDMRLQLRNMVGLSGIMHRQAHLVQFFDAWKAGDYTSAFDSLHRYYDYAMQTPEQKYYQYALLHMAVLQADFGCFGEAIAAINETIATARENQDMTCLSFSLSWLSHMSKAYPKQMRGAGYMNMLGSERDALTFLKAKAKDTKMYGLLGSTLLSEAKLSLATGDSTSRAFELIYQSSHLNFKENVNNYGGYILLISAAYSRLGLPHLADVHSRLILDCYERSCPVEERLRADGRRAFILSSSGQFREATSILENVNSSIHTSLKFQQYLTLCMGLIKLKRAIHHADWPGCTHLLAILKPSANAASSPLDAELLFLQCETHVDYLSSHGLFTEAFSNITSLSNSLKSDHTDVLQRVGVLLMQADLWRKVGKAERGFCIALRAASVSFRARLGPSLWRAIGLLGNILNEVGEWSSAKRLLESVLPQALEGMDNVLSGVLYSHLADSCMGLANPDMSMYQYGTFKNATSTISGRSWLANIAKAELYIDCSRECFRKSEYLEGECEQLMKKAVIAKLRGDGKLAEEWAQYHNRVWDEGLKRIEMEYDEGNA